MTKRAGIYVRTSTELQGKNVSPETQETDAREYCKRQGYKVIEVYRDTERYRVNGRGKLVEPSGTRADRPALTQMIQDAHAGKIDVIIAWREDRLYRSFRPMLAVLDLLDETDIDIELVKESFDKRIAPVKAWAANMELDARRDRIKMGVAGSLAQGQAVFWTPPYGYGKNDDNVFVENAAESKWVKKIFYWYAQGHTMTEIRNQLISQGARQRNDKENRHTWLPAYIYQILAKECYWTGIFTVNWGGQQYDIPIPAIIESDIARQAINRRKKYRRYPAGNLKAETIAPGLCYCRACNSLMQVVKHSTSRNGKKYHYTHYKCRARYRRGTKKKGDCCGQSPVHRIDAQIWEKLWDFIETPGKFEQALENRIAALQAQETAAEDTLEKLSQELDEVLLERQKVISWARKKVITEDDLETQLLTLTFQEKEIRKQIAEAQILTGNKSDKLIELGQKYRARVAAGVEAINAIPDSDEARKEQIKFRREIVEALVTRVDVLADKTVELQLEIDFANQLATERGALCTKSGAPGF